MGCWALGGERGQLRRATIEATLDHAAEAGIDLFDKADRYGVGASEEALHRFFAGRRH